MAAYIVYIYPIGKIECSLIDEDKCIDIYLNDKNSHWFKKSVLGLGLFYQYMTDVRFRSRIKVSNEGHLVRYFNNSAWIVVEAVSVFDAIEKSIKIIRDIPHI